MVKKRIGKTGRAMLACWLVLAAVATAAAEKPGEDPVVALVGQTEIRASELVPNENFRENWLLQFGPELLQRRLKAYYRESLRGRVIELLIEQFSREQALVATDREVAAYADYLAARFEKRLGEVQASLERLERESKSGGERPAAGFESGRLQTQRDRMQVMIAEMKEMAAACRAGTAGVTGVAEGKRERALRSYVRRWKTEKALYDRYGGEVVCGSGGLTPVEAIEALLQERLATFGVVLLRIEDQDLFDDFALPVPSGDFKLTRREAEAYWSELWWLRAADAVAAEETAVPEG